MSADELAARMPADWGMAAAPTFVSLDGAVAGCLLDGHPGEVSAPASDNHILSLVTRGERRHRHWHDARLVTDGFLPSHSVNIVPAGCAPRAVITEPIRVLHVYLPHRHLMKLAGAMRDNAPRADIEVINPHYAPDQELEGLLRALGNGLRDGTAAGALWREGLCQAICARVIQRWSNIGQGNGPRQAAPGIGLAPWQLRRALDQLAADLAAEPPLRALAAEVGLSPFHFARAFKASTGRPPHRQLIELRLAKARELLETTDRSVTDIAAALGYDDPGYFARLFRKEIGTTPAAYRRQHRT